MTHDGAVADLARMFARTALSFDSRNQVALEVFVDVRKLTLRTCRLRVGSAENLMAELAAAGVYHVLDQVDGQLSLRPDGSQVCVIASLGSPHAPTGR